MKDFKIEIDGNLYQLKADYRSLSDIEQSLGKSLYLLFADFKLRGIFLFEQVKIIYHAVKSGGHLLSEDLLGEIICRNGINSNISLLFEFLNSSIGETKCNKL